MGMATAKKPQKADADGHLQETPIDIRRCKITRFGIIFVDAHTAKDSTLFEAYLPYELTGIIAAYLAPPSAAYQRVVKACRERSLVEPNDESELGIAIDGGNSYTGRETRLGYCQSFWDQQDRRSLDAKEETAIFVRYRRDGGQLHLALDDWFHRDFHIDVHISAARVRALRQSMSSFTITRRSEITGQVGKPSDGTPAAAALYPKRPDQFIATITASTIHIEHQARPNIFCFLHWLPGMLAE